MVPPVPVPAAAAFLRPLRGIAALPELREHLALRQQLPHRAGALAVEVPAEPGAAFSRGRGGSYIWDRDHGIVIMVSWKLQIFGSRSFGS